MRVFVLVAFALSFFSRAATAQDLHNSQFSLNPIHLSPASTGLFRGDMRAAALYRSQWTSVPVSYQSFSGAFDWKAFRRNTNMVSGGILLQHDRAGDAALTWTQVGFTGAVAHALGKSQALSAGFGIAFAQRSFDISGLKFKNQWGGDFFDPALPTKETFGHRSGLFPSISAGLNWLYEPTESRSSIQAGLGIFHLNRPVISFSDDAAQRLPIRFTLHANADIQWTEWLDLVAIGALQQMTSGQEVVLGAGLRWILSNDAPSPTTAVQFTLSDRLGDALIPAVQIQRGSWTLGISYDWNTSSFANATNGQGGIEVAVVYRTLPVPPPKVFKACPIF